MDEENEAMEFWNSLNWILSDAELDDMLERAKTSDVCRDETEAVIQELRTRREQVSALERQLQAADRLRDAVRQLRCEAGRDCMMYGKTPLEAYAREYDKAGDQSQGERDD